MANESASVRRRCQYNMNLQPHIHTHSLSLSHNTHHKHFETPHLLAKQPQHNQMPSHDTGFPAQPYLTYLPIIAT